MEWTRTAQRKETETPSWIEEKQIDHLRRIKLNDNFHLKNSKNAQFSQVRNVFFSSKKKSNKNVKTQANNKNHGRGRIDDTHTIYLMCFRQLDTHRKNQLTISRMFATIIGDRSWRMLRAYRSNCANGRCIKRFDILFDVCILFYACKKHGFRRKWKNDYNLWDARECEGM